MDESHPWAQIGASSPVAPSAPQSLATTAGSGSVSLTWTPPASNGGAAVSGYNIYRGTSPNGEGGTPVATVSGTSFTDTGLTNGTTYYYKVAAVNSAGSITLTYPSSAETHVSVDEFSGITGIDTSAGATGTTAAFSSGTAPATTQATDVLIGVVGIESGKSPTWASGWTGLPVLSVSSDFLDTAYQMATVAGSYAASGTASGEWMASIVTLKTS